MLVEEDNKYIWTVETKSASKLSFAEILLYLTSGHFLKRFYIRPKSDYIVETE